MKMLLLCLMLLSGARTAPTDSLLVITWNIENCFDWQCDSLSSSEIEFSSRGDRHWTRKRFEAKTGGIAKTLLAAADRFGRFPDVVALQEIENGKVLRRLVSDTPLRKLDIGTVHYESPDPRGIDCGILYNRSTLKLCYSAPCHLYDSCGRVIPTRDILLAVFACPGGENIAVLVNHHPSRLGSSSDTRRAIAYARMEVLADSLLTAGVCKRLVCVGDFNNPMQWADPECRSGSLKFNGKWERIDGCALARGVRVREEVLDFPFLLTHDSAHGGLKPLRTYSGPRYLGGLSDHLPVAVSLE